MGVSVLKGLVCRNGKGSCIGSKIRKVTFRRLMLLIAQSGIMSMSSTPTFLGLIAVQSDLSQAPMAPRTTLVPTTKALSEGGEAG